MNITMDQISKVSEKVFADLQKAECIYVEEGGEDAVINLIMNVFHSDLSMEKRVTRDARRYLEEKKGLADQTNSTEKELLEDIKKTIARNKDYVITNGKERSESQTNKIIKALWRLDEIDFYVDDNFLRKQIFASIQMFIAAENGFLDEVTQILSKQYSNLTPHSEEWNVMFEKISLELRSRKNI